jgi:hypothetical protein
MGGSPMSTKDDRLLEALARIAEVASAAIHDEDDHAYDGNGSGRDGSSKEKIACTPKSLPTNLQIKAAETAVRYNPVNAPRSGAAARAAAGLVLDRLRISVMTSRYWGPMQRTLPVSFLDNPSSQLRKMILNHMNAWSKTASFQFVETSGTGVVRIAREIDGYWSYVGTDILHIASGRPTMNLEGFTTKTPESEFRRVVRHETGHTLGFPHEHMRKELVALIDPKKAYVYFLKTQGWSKDVVDAQVLTPLDEGSIFGTNPDQASIMCYQIPGSITRNGRPIIGGTDINAMDYAFAGQIYPKVSHQGEAQDELYPEKGSDSDEFLEEAASPF